VSDAENRVAAPRRGPVPGYKRPMLTLSDGTVDTPIAEELQRLLVSNDPLDAAIFELWRGRSVVSSVTAARLSREKADALLVALGEMPKEAIRDARR